MNIGNQAFGCGYQASECSFPTCGCWVTNIDTWT
jgi:hypothetical protein